MDDLGRQTCRLALTRAERSCAVADGGRDLVPGFRRPNSLQPDDCSDDPHPRIVRFQVVLDQMSGGAQCRLEIGLMTVPLHQLVGGAPDVSVRGQFRSNQVRHVPGDRSSNTNRASLDSSSASETAKSARRPKSGTIQYGHRPTLMRHHTERPPAFGSIAHTMEGRQWLSGPLDGPIGRRSHRQVSLLTPPSRQFEQRTAVVRVAGSLRRSHTKTCLDERFLPVHVQFL